MFPVIQINVIGLDPDKIYNTFLDMRQIDGHSWKFQKAFWQKHGKAEPQPGEYPGGD